MNESPILAAALYDRVAYSAIEPHIGSQDFSSHGGIFWGEIQAYYQRDPKALLCDKGIILDRVIRQHPKHESLWRDTAKSLTPELGSINVAREVLELKKRVAGDSLVMALAGSSSSDELRPLLSQFQELNDSVGLLDAGGGNLFETPLSEVIKAAEDEGNRVKLLPKRLNEYLRGGVLPGHCVVIFGRVNVGKSTLAIHNAAGFLRQGKKVLYIENEDLLEDTAIRLGNRLVGCTRDWAKDNPEKYQEIAHKRGFGNCLIPDPAPATIADVDRMLESTKADVCVINQARNLTKGAKDVVSQLDSVANHLREIGKRRRIIMVLVTAATEGEKGKNGKVQEKPVLQKADSYSSRTGFPAAADVMLGFGSSESLESRGMRCISLCKNKLGSKDGETEPVLYVNVDFETGVIS